MVASCFGHSLFVGCGPCFLYHWTVVGDPLGLQWLYIVVFRQPIDCFHALRVLWVKSVDSIISCHLLRCDSEISMSGACPSLTVSLMNGSSVNVSDGLHSSLSSERWDYIHTCTAATRKCSCAMLFLQKSHTYRSFRELEWCWQYIFPSHLRGSANQLSWGCTVSERGIPWSDDGIYLDANWFMLSLKSDFHHTCFDLLCNTIRYEGYVWVVALSPSFTTKYIGLLSIMNEGHLVRFPLLLYQCAIFVCRYVSPIHTITVEITNDHIQSCWGQRSNWFWNTLYSESQLLLRCHVHPDRAQLQ